MLQATYFLASDHAGVGHKSYLLPVLKNRYPSCGFFDLGPQETLSVDYPHYAHQVVEKIRCSSASSYGILICGTGIGMSIAANRFPGIRAALCHDEVTATFAKKHNDANVLCLGARILTPEKMSSLIFLWMESSFEGGRHNQRLEMLETLADCRSSN
jgi:ribose 5-phosphate isomerase B